MFQDEKGPDKPEIEADQESLEKREKEIMVDVLNGQTEIERRMISFLKTHYSKTLGTDIELLDQPGGLEILHKKYTGNN